MTVAVSAAALATVGLPVALASHARDVSGGVAAIAPAAGSAPTGGWPADVLNVVCVAIVLVLAFVAAMPRGGCARVHLESSPEAGTRLLAELPCGS